MMVLMCPVLGVFHPVASIIKSSGVGPELVDIHHAWLSAHFSTTVLSNGSAMMTAP